MNTLYLQQQQTIQISDGGILTDMPSLAGSNFMSIILED
jgi:hypothetical protein